MSKIPVEIVPITIHVDGPLSLSTGFRRGLIHRTVERDADGFAYIPASSLKGRVRRACEQLAKGVGLRVCNAPRPDGMCSAHRQACLVCRVFGGPGQGSNLRWRDAQLTEACRRGFQPNLSAQFYDRTQVQLSRALGTAMPDRLFTSESTVEGLGFELGITGWLDVTPIAGEDATGGYELLLLLAGLKLVNTVGGGASRGAGWIGCSLPDQVKINNVAIAWKDVLDNLDLLYGFDKEVNNGN